MKKVLRLVIQFETENMILTGFDFDWVLNFDIYFEIYTNFHLALFFSQVNLKVSHERCIVDAVFAFRFTL